MAAARPTNRSRTIAIVTTDAAAAPTPCSTRRPPSTAMLGATRHSSDASTCTPTPPSSGRLRPNVSERGPTSSWPSASPASVPVRVSWTAADVVPRSSTIVGSAGRYMSIVSGPSAISAPRTSTSRRRPHPVGGATAVGAGSVIAVTKCLSGLYASGKYFPVQGLRNRTCSRREPSHGSRDRDGLPCGHARRADGAVHVHDLRRDVRPRRADRCDQPRPGIPRHRRPRVAARRRRRERHRRRQPVPAGARGRLAAHGGRGAPEALLRPRRRPRPRADHDRGDGGDRVGGAGTVRPGRRGRHLPALLRLLRRDDRALRRDAAGRPAAATDLRLRPGRAARRVLAPHPGRAGQHPAQPDRQPSSAASS